MSDTPSLAPETSPLVEADPGSLNELIRNRIDEIFNKPPALITDEDLKVQVEYYRRERVRFLTESALKESKPRAKRKIMSVADALSSSEDLL